MTEDKTTKEMQEEQKQDTSAEEVKETAQEAVSENVGAENTEKDTNKEGEASEKPADEKVEGEKKDTPRGKRRFQKKPFKKRKFSKRRREERKPEFEQKIISMRRVTRVVAGGRRFSFSVAMVIGDKKGRVGVGLGKSNDTTLAIEKAVRDAKANMITVNRNEGGSIPFDVKYKFGSSEVEIRPAPGRGLVAGASVRAVLDMAGVTDVTSKIWTRSKNQINIARATIEALKFLND